MKTTSSEDMVGRVDGAGTLEAKAEGIGRLVWDRCRSPEGLVYCFVMADRLERVTQADVAAGAPEPEKLSPGELMYDDEKLEVRRVAGRPQYLMQGRPVEDVEAYEDSLYATGTYLSALCFQYQATFDPAVVVKAQAVFGAMYQVYELGQQEQPGWIPKPYGFQCTRQSSMDNQCPYYQGLVRYFKIAGDADRARIRRVLTDQMDYWIRNRYKMHVSYFGIWVDFLSEEHYPGHWPLAYLPLCDAVWKITGESKYRQEYEWLMGRLKIEAGKDPDYLLTKIACLHRWYYEYGALLEQGADEREKWIEGLGYQIRAIEKGGSEHGWGYSFDQRHHKYIWLSPHRAEDLSQVEEMLRTRKVNDFLYQWPAGYTVPPTLAFRTRALYMTKVAQWLEVYWKGRTMGHW